MVSEKEAFRPWESQSKKIQKHKSSISTSDRAVQCAFLTHQPVELIKLNAKSEGCIYKNGGYYPRKRQEKSEAIKRLTSFDDDFNIDENNCIESRRLDDPMPRRQSSRNRRPPKRFHH